VVDPRPPHRWRTQACRFDTPRLSAVPWHDARTDGSLTEVVLDLLTPAVTRTLPPAWQQVHDHEQAQRWIAERDRESTVLLVTATDEEPVGLVILGEEPATGSDSGAIDVRLGYLLAPGTWGRGLASELVAGLVGWCQAEPQIGSLTGGVASDNPASARVLTNHGFEVIDATGDDHTYRITW
jgi:RimJ/RimL family protein N-acetyltransferase